MAAVVTCLNREVNLQMCPCTSEECERRGICCLCTESHASKGGQSACMRGVERPADTLSLAGCGTKCDRYQENLEFCPCSYEACGNRGTCCDCIRNHWGNSTYPTAACMR